MQDICFESLHFFCFAPSKFFFFKSLFKSSLYIDLVEVVELEGPNFSKHLGRTKSGDDDAKVRC